MEKKFNNVDEMREAVQECTAAERAAFGNNLKAIRECRGLSQNEAAEMCDMSERHYGEIERGNANFTIETCVGLCIGFNVSMYDLFGDFVMAIMSDLD